jgi:hypothetical protein
LGISCDLRLASIAAVWWPNPDGESKCRGFGLRLSNEVFLTLINEYSQKATPMGQPNQNESLATDKATFDFP